MINRTTLLRCSTLGLLAVLAVEPTPAQAGICAGPRVPWGSTSDTFGMLDCNQIISRGRSFGQFNTQGGIEIPFRLSVELIDGIHANGVPFNSFGNPIEGCNPFDDTEGDGAEFVQGIGCLGGTTHQVIVVF